jgi:hypothetical protein
MKRQRRVLNLFDCGGRDRVVADAAGAVAAVDVEKYWNMTKEYDDFAEDYELALPARKRSTKGIARLQY